MTLGQSLLRGLNDFASSVDGVCFFPSCTSLLLSHKSIGLDW